MVSLPSLPSVIPAVAMSDRPEVPRWRPPARPVARRPLPLAKLSEGRAGSATYGLSTLDTSGRIADRQVMQALTWTAGCRLDIRESEGLAVVAADDSGVFRVTGKGYVHLPATVRHWCRLEQGDRVLLAAYPSAGVLVVHTPAALDALIDAIHAKALREVAA